MKAERKKKKFFIYDARYNSFDGLTRDRAIVFEICDTRKEAEQAIRENYPTDSVIVEEEL